MIAAVLDFETTGLCMHPQAKIAMQPRAIEIGISMVDENGDVIAELGEMCNPGFKLDPVITKITGITDEDLADKPPFTALLPDIKRLMRNADILVAHNLPFDRDILRYELARAKETDFPWPARNLCTAQLYAEIWGRRPRLLDLYEWSIGVPLAQTHRAIDDVRALVEVVKKERLISLFHGLAS